MGTNLYAKRLVWKFGSHQLRCIGNCGHARLPDRIYLSRLLVLVWPFPRDAPNFTPVVYGFGVGGDTVRHLHLYSVAMGASANHDRTGVCEHGIAGGSVLWRASFTVAAYHRLLPRLYFNRCVWALLALQDGSKKLTLKTE